MTAAVLSSCNKDDVIPGGDDQPGGTQRPADSHSRAECNRVFEYTPAPGQFINESLPGVVWNDATTPEDAARWAKSRLDVGLYVSLGGFGGYIVVGFDHSIVSSNGDYDFYVAGNAFSSSRGNSSEPGIVSVMQDANGNGLPDDVWYELRGSETGKSTETKDYSVTYFRPEVAGENVKWSDNLGNSGEIEYMALFHSQDSYYPVWVKGNRYTLSGTLLAPNSSEDEKGVWSNNPYGWGYADNMGSDNVAIGERANCNRFRISDAVKSDGTPANLKYIDFVKITTAVNYRAGILGEISTEVCGVADLAL